VVNRCNRRTCSPVYRSKGPGSLKAVWGLNPTDVFAVGGAGHIVHYDGVTWIHQPSIAQHTLKGVWGSSATDVFAVGAESTVLHYDGHSWRREPLPIDSTLHGVWGSGPCDVYAVGSGGEGVVLRRSRP